jgi:uncharacterized protein (DUF433 family)
MVGNFVEQRHVFGKLGAGVSIEELLAAYPFLNKELF